MDDEMPQAAPAEVPKRHGAKRAADSSADESQPSGAKLNTKTLSNRKGPVRARRASRISAAAVAKAVNSDDDVVEREAAPTKRLKAAACTPVSDDSDDDVIERVAPKKRRKAVARTTVSDDIDDDVVERKAPKRRKAAARALVIEDDDENKDDGGDEEAGDTDEISSDGKADGDHVESGGAGGGASAAKTTAVAAGKKIVTGKVVKRKVVKKFAKWFSWPSDYETLPELNEDVWKEVCSFVDPIDVAHLVHGGGSYFDVLAPPRVWAGALAQRFPHGVTLMENEKFAAAYCALVHGLCRFCYKSLDGEQTKNHGGVAASLPFFSPKSGLAILGKGAQWKTAAAAAKKKGSMGSAGAGAGGDEAQEEDVTEAGAIEGETPDECLRRRLLAPASSTSRYGRRFMAPPVAEPQPEVPLVGLKAWQLAAREADAKEAARGPVAARFFEERRDAWFLKSSIEDRQQIRNKSRWEPITGVEALWRTQDSLLKSGGEVPPVSFRRSSGKPWGGMYPGPSPPIHCCAKCRRDTDICMGLKQAERQFGLGKNSLLSVRVGNEQRRTDCCIHDLTTAPPSPNSGNRRTSPSRKGSPCSATSHELKRRGAGTCSHLTRTSSHSTSTRATPTRWPLPRNHSSSRRGARERASAWKRRRSATWESTGRKCTFYETRRPASFAALSRFQLPQAWLRLTQVRVRVRVQARAWGRARVGMSPRALLLGQCTLSQMSTQRGSFRTARQLASTLQHCCPDSSRAAAAFTPLSPGRSRHSRARMRPRNTHA